MKKHKITIIQIQSAIYSYEVSFSGHRVTGLAASKRQAKSQTKWIKDHLIKSNEVM